MGIHSPKIDGAWRLPNIRMVLEMGSMTIMRAYQIVKNSLVI
jgi:hypothetical protein